MNLYLTVINKHTYLLRKWQKPHNWLNIFVGRLNKLRIKI